MAGQEIIVFGGKEIIVQEIRGVTDPDIGIAVFNKTRELIVKRPQKSVLLLTDVSDAVFNAKALDMLKKFSRDVTPFVKASAAVGIVGLKKIVIQTLSKVSGRNIKIFETVEDAKKWLVSQ